MMISALCVSRLCWKFVVHFFFLSLSTAYRTNTIFKCNRSQSIMLCS